MLPHFLQEKWTTLASSYKKSHQVSFPPFSFFVRFIRDICEIRNDPAFSHSNYNQSTASKTRPSVISRRLDITSNNSNRCPLHKSGHTLNDCRGFRKRSLQDRQKFLRENRICFKCCESNEHIAKKMYSKYKMSNMWEYPSCYNYAYGPICSESATNFNTKNYNR